MKETSHSPRAILRPAGLRNSRITLCRSCLTIFVVLAGASLPAQEALRNSIAGEAAAEARRIQSESMAYLFKAGDLKLRVVPSLGVDWNDNVNTSKSNREDDFILRPQVQIGLDYPITRNNRLNLNIGVGYDKYFDHDELSAWRLTSGSELSFDIYVKDFWINLHDRVSYTQDSATDSAVAGTGKYGTINNSAGLLVTWDLRDVTPSLGYDHVNVISPESDFSSQDHASEMIVGRVSFRVHPRVSTGLEATASFTTYDDNVLNDNDAYSVGVFADWQPGSFLRVQPRAGYSTYQFKETAQTTRTSDLNSWYGDLTVTHDISKVVSYAFSAGHEVRLGIESDVNKVTYFRPRFNWRIIKDTTLTSYFSYEHGKQGVGNDLGNLTETYDWVGMGFGVRHPFTDQFSVALNYRLTLRSSDDASREYTQNVIGILLTYEPK